ncbi:MAG: signal recognition particle-docking protein FtsY [Thermoprotei archaeon]
MFRKIREALSSFVSTLGEAVSKKELSEKEFNEIFDEFQWLLLEGDVAFEAVEILRSRLAKKLVSAKVPRLGNSREYVLGVIKETLKELLTESTFGKDLCTLVSESQKPYVVVFLGVNGVGKTTTIAKVAYKLRNSGFKPLIVAADTFRAGALEQLEIHAGRIGVPLIKGKYGADPAAVAKDGVVHAVKNKYDAVLIDTAGRMHTDRDLMEELRKVVRVVKPNLKILVLDALVGNDAVAQARWFDEAVGVDTVILTKVDADVKGGSALSIILTLGKKILYVGAGQKYDDLLEFNPDLILNNLLSINT